jgi:hypothetical protein
MKARNVLASVAMGAWALLAFHPNAGATALPAGLYDPKDCGAATCFTIQNTNSSATAVAIRGVVGPDVGHGAGAGVVGTSVSGPGVDGGSLTGSGVYGSSFTGAGIKGEQTDDAVGGIGVYGTSIIGNGVVGSNTRTDLGAAAISALAGSDAGLAYWGTGGIIITSSLAQKAGGGSWSAPSDARIKKDVKDFRQGLSELKRVRAVTFKYNGLGGTSDDGKEYVGVIAQELEKVFPSMVSTMKGKLHKGDANDTDIKHVDPSAFTYLLINAVQEQQKIIEQQESRIAKLERAPAIASAFYGSNLGAGLAIGLLPLGLIFARKRRGDQQG